METFEIYRKEFPVTQHLSYFNHAAVAPISKRTSSAMQKVLDDVAQFGAHHWRHWYSAVEQIRSKAAQLMGASAGEIAFVKNTSEGISLMANGLELGRGDKVVSVNGEFPANIYPWLKLEETGVEIDLVKQREGRIDLQELVEHLDARTKVLAISFVQFLSGYRSDLKFLGSACRDRNILFVVDAIQGMGAFPLDVKECNIDALSADAHKWLLGPEAIGILYCTKELIRQIKPSTVGWTSVKNWSDYLNYKLEYRETAARFECGTLNTIGIYGLGAAIDLLFEVGIKNVQDQILKLTDYLCAGLIRKGYNLYSSREREEASGIVSFSCPQFSSEELNHLLKEEKIEVSPRCGKVRVSPHFYNNISEIDRLLEVLPSL
jgi:cysteine desulfurase / selenocysteine lyase